MNELVSAAGGPEAFAAIMLIAIVGAVLVTVASLAVTVRSQR